MQIQQDQDMVPSGGAGVRKILYYKWSISDLRTQTLKCPKMCDSEHKHDASHGRCIPDLST